MKGLDRDRPGNPLHTFEGKPGAEGVEGVMLCSVMNASRRMGAQHGVSDQCEDVFEKRISKSNMWRGACCQMHAFEERP